MSDLPAMLVGALSVAGAFAFPFLLGWQLVRASAGGALRAAFGRGGEAGFAFGVGVTIASAVLGLVYAAHVPHAGVVAHVLVALAGLALWWWRRSRRAAPAEPLVEEPAPGGLARLARGVGWLLLAAVLGVIALLAWRSAAAFTDTHAVWLLRARVFVMDQGFDGLYFQPGWRDGHDRRGYPPLVSLATAWLYEAGGAHDRPAKLLSVLWLVALLAVAHGALRRRAGPGVALALALGLAACAAGVSITVWGTADHVLAFHVLCAGALLLCVEPRVLPRLLPWALVGAVASKNEGAPAVLAAVAAFALLRWLQGRELPAGSRAARATRDAVLVALPAVAAWLAWYAVLRAHDVPFQPTLPLSAGDAAHAPHARLAYVARELGARLAEPSMLAGWIGFALALVLLSRRPDGRAAGLAAAALVLALLAADALVFLTYPGDLPWVMQFTAGRIVYHGFPLALLVAGVVLAAPRRAA